MGVVIQTNANIRSSFAKLLILRIALVAEIINHLLVVYNLLSPYKLVCSVNKFLFVDTFTHHNEFQLLPDIKKITYQSIEDIWRYLNMTSNADILYIRIF